VSDPAMPASRPAASALGRALQTVVRKVTVAAGVFAPGHLGELTRHVPFELVDAVLDETGATQRRLRDLPSRVGVFFVLALGLFPRQGQGKVWDKLVASLVGLPLPSPSGKALRDVRRRLGAAPFQALFESLAGPVAQPSTPGVRFGRYRTVAFDGCVSTKAPDSKENRSWLGKMKAALGTTGYPVVELMALVETGTRAILGATFGPPATGETDYARILPRLLTKDMLMLADRGFDAGDFLEEVARSPCSRHVEGAGIRALASFILGAAGCRLRAWARRHRGRERWRGMSTAYESGRPPGGAAGCGLARAEMLVHRCVRGGVSAGRGR
jgi:Insertion element 4 transposase N-terminal